MRSPNPRTFNASTSPNVVNDPIQPAPKGKKGKKRKNVFYDNRGFPDQSEEFEYLLHRTGGGKVIRKRLHPAPSLDEVDQKFNTPFDEKKHGEKLRRELKVDHLPPDLQKDLTELIKSIGQCSTTMDCLSRSKITNETLTLDQHAPSASRT